MKIDKNHKKIDLREINTNNHEKIKLDIRDKVLTIIMFSGSINNKKNDDEEVVRRY